MPSNNISWGRNTVNQVVGIGPRASDFELRAQYSWYGPHSAAKVSDDWGCPNPLDGRLAAPHYMGTVVLHADKSPQDPADDRAQPSTTTVVGSDDATINYGADQFNATTLAARYRVVAAGHPAQTHADQVGDGFADQWGSDPGGYSQGQGFGPYTLAPGDSIHIVLAEAVSGIGREKSMEVGRNWYQWVSGQSQPQLTLPDGSTTLNADLYKKLWVKSGEDSIRQTFRRAAALYEAGYRIPSPPPPPEIFEVNSGGDRITLTWSANAESDQNFDGYEVYRTMNRPDTLYQKVFSCGKADAVNKFEDYTAQRGFDYYYYVVSKDDGSRNSAHPGVPLAELEILHHDLGARLSQKTRGADHARLDSRGSESLLHRRGRAAVRREHARQAGVLRPAARMRHQNLHRTRRPDRHHHAQRRHGGRAVGFDDRVAPDRGQRRVHRVFRGDARRHRPGHGRGPAQPGSAHRPQVFRHPVKRIPLEGHYVH